MTVEKMENVLPGNSVDLGKIRSKLHEVSGSFHRIAAEKDMIKTVVSDIAEEFDLDKKLINKLAKAYHDSTKDQIIAEAEEFELAYEKVFGASQI